MNTLRLAELLGGLSLAAGLDGRIRAMRRYVDTAKHLSAEAGEAHREERAAQYG